MRGYCQVREQGCDQGIWCLEPATPQFRGDYRLDRFQLLGRVHAEVDLCRADIGVAIGGGCWVLGITTAAESFGTNLRATVTTMVPNVSRAATIPMTLGLAALKDHMTLGEASMVVGAVVFTLALLGALLIPETFSKDLDYVEE